MRSRKQEFTSSDRLTAPQGQSSRNKMVQKELGVAEGPLLSSPMPGQIA